eukprot:5109664-Pyramimonas_sp.AAC.2
MTKRHSNRGHSSAQLVCEYVGELVTRELAQKREEAYGTEGLFYLHDVHGHYEKVDNKSRSVTVTVTVTVGQLCLGQSQSVK